MLSASLRREQSNSYLHKLQQCLLHTLTQKTSWLTKDCQTSAKFYLFHDVINDTHAVLSQGFVNPLLHNF